MTRFCAFGYYNSSGGGPTQDLHKTSSTPAKIGPPSIRAMTSENVFDENVQSARNLSERNKNAKLTYWLSKNA